jgi:hypothetical protein
MNSINFGISLGHTQISQVIFNNFTLPPTSSDDNNHIHNAAPKNKTLHFVEVMVLQQITVIQCNKRNPTKKIVYQRLQKYSNKSQYVPTVIQQKTPWHTLRPYL